MRQGNDASMHVRDLRFTSPAEFARTLRKAHEATIAGNPDPHISASLIRSWQRSLALGINPDQHRPVHRHEVSEARSLSAGHRLAAVMPALSQLLADESVAGRHLLIVTDKQGEVLWRVGSRQALRLADSLEFVEGADWSESGVGTNAISEALVTGAAAQLFSAEHLVRSIMTGPAPQPPSGIRSRAEWWVCWMYPVRSSQSPLTACAWCGAVSAS
ncbi:uncharacterized 47.3 kDa protein in thcA 5'region, partial [Arthrobacter sp. Hiyo6]